jgi:hypothetical protein
VAIAAAAIYVAHAPQRYEAHAQLLVRNIVPPPPGLTGLNLLGVTAQPNRAVETVSLLAMSPRVAGYASAALGGHPSTRAITSHEFHRYDDAGHAFFSPDRPSYRVAAANDGWERIAAFYTTHLGG